MEPAALDELIVYRSVTGFRAGSWGLLRDHSCGWDHPEVLLSLLYRLVRSLLGLLATLIRFDLSKDVELLVFGHENQVLRAAGSEAGRDGITPIGSG